jgi:hypothetical protein
VALHYNYILWFKTGKGPNKAPHDKDTLAKGVIELERVPDEMKIDTDPSEPSIFVIPTVDHTYAFKADSVDNAVSWVKYLRACKLV